MSSQNQQDQIINFLKNNFVHTSELSELLTLGLATGKGVLIKYYPGFFLEKMIIDVCKQLTKEDLTKACTITFNGNEVEENLTEVDFFNVVVKLFTYCDCLILENIDTISKRDLSVLTRVFNEAPMGIFKGKLLIATVLDNVILQSYDSLINYFPLQMTYDWLDYEKESYIDLFHIENRNHALTGFSYIQINDYFANLLAEFCSKSSARGTIITPQRACDALAVVKVSAKEGGRSQVELEDFKKLKFIKEFKKIADEISFIIEDEKLKEESRKRILSIQDKIGSFMIHLADREITKDEKHEIRKECQLLLMTLTHLPIHSDFNESKIKTSRSIHEAMEICDGKIKL